jgi:hypothetical protein
MEASKVQDVWFGAISLGSDFVKVGFTTYHGRTVPYIAGLMIPIIGDALRDIVGVHL